MAKKKSIHKKTTSHSVVSEVYKLNKIWDEESVGIGFDYSNEEINLDVNVVEYDLMVGDLIQVLMNCDLMFGRFNNKDNDLIINLYEDKFLRLKLHHIEWLPIYNGKDIPEDIIFLNDNNTLDECLASVECVRYDYVWSMLYCRNCSFYFRNGKYKGVYLFDILYEDKGYLDWYMSIEIPKTSRNIVRGILSGDVIYVSDSQKILESNMDKYTSSFLEFVNNLTCYGTNNTKMLKNIPVKNIDEILNMAISCGLKFGVVKNNEVKRGWFVIVELNNNQYIKIKCDTKGNIPEYSDDLSKKKNIKIPFSGDLRSIIQRRVYHNDSMLRIYNMNMFLDLRHLKLGFCDKSQFDKLLKVDAFLLLLGSYPYDYKTIVRSGCKLDKSKVESEIKRLEDEYGNIVRR